MKERLVYLSGEFVSENEAKISIFDAAVNLGHCVTDSARTFGHTPFKLEEHVSRLYASLKVARIDPGISESTMLKVTYELLERNLPLYDPNQDCWIVHNVSSGMSPMGPSPVQTSNATIMIANQPLILTGWQKYYHQGCHAVTPFSRQIPSQSLDSRIKNRSRMFYTLAEQEVKLVDKDAQSVILDTDGFIAENKGGNIFAVKDGVVRTSTTVNALAGLTRETTLQICDTLGIETEETRLLPYDLYTADEVFFTSTPYCLMPATKFNGLAVGDGNVGPISKAILSGWKNLTGVDVVAQADFQVEGCTK
ncbi:MAG: branched-chain amino acid aminotransferase [Planctomycetaceae bacterium]|nr:branched-chain amino acid aminotransferase [Planctomycetaceae bacterium]